MPYYFKLDEVKAVFKAEMIGLPSYYFTTFFPNGLIKASGSILLCCYYKASSNF